MCQTFKCPKFGNKCPGIRAGTAPTPKNLVRYLQMHYIIIITCNLSSVMPSIPCLNYALSFFSQITELVIRHKDMKAIKFLILLTIIHKKKFALRIEIALLFSEI
jgi:hypothetical protein